MLRQEKDIKTRKHIIQGLTSHSSLQMSYSKLYVSASFDPDALQCDHHSSSKTASKHYRMIV